MPNLFYNLLLWAQSRQAKNGTPSLEKVHCRQPSEALEIPLFGFAAETTNFKKERG